ASKAVKSYVKGIGKGLKKVMSKMGISTYMSYTGSQIFEAVGLARSLVDKYCTGTTSNVEGIDVFDVAEEAIRVHRAAFDEDDPAAAIVKRFSTGAMSLGSISTEAHTTLAIAMNRIGGKSNTGEGGEDRRRYAPIKAGESLQSRLGKTRVEVEIRLREGDSL